MSAPATVFVVEDDPATRRRLGQAVDERSELVLVGTAGTVAEAAEAIETAAPRVLLVDLDLPDGSGIELIARFRGGPAETECMVITVFGDEGHIVAAIEAGATGYLLKDDPAAEIAGAIDQLLRGGSPISPSIARRLLERFRPPEPPSTTAPALTSREREVLVHLVKGFTFGEIAGLLEISAHTVSTHVKHIYEKLAVHSRGEAVYEAFQLGLVDRDT